MKSITIRGVDSNLDQALKKAASAEARSINQLVLEVLRERFGLSKPPRHTRKHHDLDDLFGSWGEEECERIQGAVDEQRKIDPELWS
ncbi:FitA-like ribbon-helix-helix domain-containing protein [Endothiovibrio diazotrophicus]